MCAYACMCVCVCVECCDWLSLSAPTRIQSIHGESKECTCKVQTDYSIAPLRPPAVFRLILQWSVVASSHYVCHLTGLFLSFD